MRGPSILESVDRAAASNGHQFFPGKGAAVFIVYKNVGLYVKIGILQMIELYHFIEILYHLIVTVEIVASKLGVDYCTVVKQSPAFAVADLIGKGSVSLQNILFNLEYLLRILDAVAMPRLPSALVGIFHA